MTRPLLLPALVLSAALHGCGGSPPAAPSTPADQTKATAQPPTEAELSALFDALSGGYGTRATLAKSARAAPLGQQDVERFNAAADVVRESWKRLDAIHTAFPDWAPTLREWFERSATDEIAAYAKEITEFRKATRLLYPPGTREQELVERATKAKDLSALDSLDEDAARDRMMVIFNLSTDGDARLRSNRRPPSGPGR